jgi:hypothetical protein
LSRIASIQDSAEPTLRERNNRTRSFTYDINDNLLTETWGSTRQQTYTYTNTTTNISHYHYTYNSGNRLILPTGNDGNKAVDSVEYLYDAQDKRVGKKIDGIIQERYIYDRGINRMVPHNLPISIAASVMLITIN